MVDVDRKSNEYNLHVRQQTVEQHGKEYENTLSNMKK